MASDEKGMVLSIALGFVPGGTVRSDVIPCSRLHGGREAGFSRHTKFSRARIFDHAMGFLHALPQRGHSEFDNFREFATFSSCYDRWSTATAIKAHLRDLILLFRSLALELSR